MTDEITSITTSDDYYRLVRKVLRADAGECEPPTTNELRLGVEYLQERRRGAAKPKKKSSSKSSSTGGKFSGKTLNELVGK